MNPGRTVFAHLMDFVSLYEFRKCVDRYEGQYKVRRFSWRRLLAFRGRSKLPTVPYPVGKPSLSPTQARTVKPSHRQTAERAHG